MAPGVIMLVCRSDDIAADVVVLALTGTGVPFVRVNTDWLPTRTRLTWALHDSALMLDGSPIVLDRISAVWCRRLHGAAVTSRPSPQAETYVKAESQTALFGLLETAPVTRWMNRPSSTRRAENKILQLRTAATLGFSIPETVVSNDPIRARAFARATTVVAKPLHAGRIRTGAGAKLLFAHVIEDFSTVDDSEIVACPVIYQSRIEKAFDVRVTVVGDKIFATKICAPDEPVDWRAAPSDEVSYEPYPLSDDVASKCVALVKHFELTYGAIDLVVTPSGATYFLEINPAGQWAWLERATGQPITGAIVEQLVT